MNKLKKFYYFCDTFYYKKGITTFEIRQVLIGQSFIFCFSLIMSCITWWNSLWMTWFSVGSLMGLWNFYMLVKQVVRATGRTEQRWMIFLFIINTNMRLLITSVLGYIALVRLNASGFSLLLGFCSIMLCILFVSIKNLLVKKIFPTDNSRLSDVR